jgi:hypothetical protein
MAPLAADDIRYGQLNRLSCDESSGLFGMLVEEVGSGVRSDWSSPNFLIPHVQARLL